ncbi:heterokaryon incompatibility protein-domain-containing protein [Dichomitus squalens]|uniref:Heterokaryon incompatibility protein-domain-containing protein n=2 Tax=Dichomitus squalens TaxID=114155 RepID=A0A4Q9PJP5_9APHY|nr:heterokaryon incompatibility protein-domain-containing protein [Dichomitus squalens]
MSQIRLLNTRTGKFETFTDPQTVDYAILSHVWTKETSGRLAEQDHQDIIRLQQQSSDPNSSILVNERLSPKIRQACELAKADGYEWIWIDSCCIDKVSSTELSRSINSMYDWYRYASICYAHLADVDDGDAAATDAPDRPSEAQIVRFRQSAWFTRGWTLQELIAPSMVVFLSKNWRRIGTKHTLAAVIEDVTSVDRQVLRGQRPLSDVCVAQRMAWAWNRRTTMEEDKAYCLVGIFGVQLAPMYGEGHNAFVRLQEEILKHIPDQTIFAWGDTMELRDLRSALRAGELPRAFPRQHLVPQSDSPPLSDSYLFASSPQKFLRASAGLALQSLSPDLGAGNAEYTITPYGIRATFPLMPVDPDHEDDSRTSEYFLALLGCRDQLKGRSVALLLRKLNNAFIPASSRSVGVKFDSVTAKETTYIRLVLLDEAEARIGQKALSSIIYVPYRVTHTTQQIADDAHFETALHFSRTPIEITIPSWCRNLLERQGYKIIQDNRYHGDTSVTGYHAITLESRSQQSENVNLQLGHCSKCDEKALRATVSGDPLKANHARRSAASSDRGCAQEHLRSWHTYDRAVSKVFNVPTPFLADRCVQLTLRLKDRFGSVLGRYTLEIEILDLDHLGKKSSPQAKRSQSGMVIGAPYGMDRVGGRSRSADGTERKLVPDDPHFSVGGPYTTDNIPRPAPRYLTRR